MSAIANGRYEYESPEGFFCGDGDLDFELRLVWRPFRTGDGLGFHCLDYMYDPYDIYPFGVFVYST